MLLEKHGNACSGKMVSEKTLDMGLIQTFHWEEKKFHKAFYLLNPGFESQIRIKVGSKKEQVTLLCLHE